MPTYDYACEACGKKWELEQRISADPIKKCPKCGKLKARRLISGANFILKGGGWYADLYSKPPSSRPSKSDEGSSSSSDSGSDSGSTTSSDSSSSDSSDTTKPTKAEKPDKTTKDGGKKSGKSSGKKAANS